MKTNYIIENEQCDEIAVFTSENDRQQWIEQNCYYDGSQWKMHGNDITIYAYEERTK